MKRIMLLAAATAGRWLRERHGYHYVPEHWDDRHGHWHFVPGHWDRG